MLLIEKHRPKTSNDFIFNRSILDELTFMAGNEDINHTIFSGPKGAGKKTLAKNFLENLYGPDVNNLTKVKYNICGGSSPKKEIEIMQSNYHIIIEPTNTNHDKYILQEVIKQYASHRTFDIFKSRRKFKTILIYNIENLANNSQAALRRTMETYARACRFVMLCNNLSKISGPLRSRCVVLCIPAPTLKQIDTVISDIELKENIILSDERRAHIIGNCNSNLKTAIWILEEYRLKCPMTVTLDEVFDTVTQLILTKFDKKDIVKVFDVDIRTHIYNILITNIKGSEILTILFDRLIEKIDDNEICAKLLACAARAEHKLVHGRRDITCIDPFIAGAISILYDSNFKYKCPQIKPTSVPKSKSTKSKIRKRVRKTAAGSKRSSG